MRETNISLL